MSSSMPKSDSIQIRDVWVANLDSEFELIRGIVDKYNYVAMDTEFPGVVLAPLGEFKNSTDRSYFALRENANIMKLIQLGLTFTDENGNLPTCGTDKYCVWQFNFREFDPDDDICMPNSVELLRGSGIDFVRNKEEGIDSARFGELLMPSDVVLSDSIHWVTFHGGYDFGYLLKLLKGRDLPETQEEFFVLIKLLFPTLYDIKHLMTFAGLHGGLNKLAEVLGVERVGTSHQAGSDSLLTSFTFRKLREKYFSDGSVEKYSGVVYGLGVEN